MLGVWAMLDWMMHRHRLQLSPAMLEVKTSFYSQSVPLSELKLDEARVVDLRERTEFNPGLKTNGYSVPGYKSGRFRLKNGQKAFVAIAGERRALWLPTTRGCCSRNNPTPCSRAYANWRQTRRAVKLRRCAANPES